MLSRYFESRIAAEERALGESLDYLRYLLRSSLPAFLRYIRILPMADYRRELPVEAIHTAALLASRHEGCGACVRIEISRARNAGVGCRVIAAVLDDDLAKMPMAVRDVYEFTLAILRDKPHQSALRARIVDNYGDAALIELGMRVASSRVFPLMTRILGFESHSVCLDLESSACTKLDYDVSE